MAVIAPERRAWGATALLNVTQIDVPAPPGAAAGDLLVFVVNAGEIGRASCRERVSCCV